MYPSQRLDAETYARVKAAGFAWAPKQELFVAPMWTPSREDVALDLAGTIDDEDTSLAERADVRAERFDEYSGKRASEAHASREAAERLAGSIPLGQPILVGHHSEARARRDAERIREGFKRAVNLWDTAEYWRRRAAGAVRHAKHKERTDVRVRRIRTIEADQRKVQRKVDESAHALKLWTHAHDAEATTLKRRDGQPTTFAERALHIANTDHVSREFPLADYPRQPPASQYEGTMSLWSALDGGVITPEQAQAIAIDHHTRNGQHLARWVAHYANRLEYERGMLAEGGGLAADQFDFAPGGTITHRGRRSVVLKLNREGNRKDGRLLSLTVTGQSWTVGLEEVTAYEPPTAEAAEAAAKVTKVAPLCNYDRGEACARMTEAQYKALYEGSRLIRRVAATATHEAHRVRMISGYKSREFGGPACASYDVVPVFLTDAKVKPAPLVGAEPAAPRKGRNIARAIAQAAGVETSGAQEPETVETEAAQRTPREVFADATAPTMLETAAQVDRAQEARARREECAAAAAPFAAIKAALREGVAVQVVSAPQLFPTPAALAARMIDLADLAPGARVLEPSAGTGRLLGALPCVLPAGFAASRQTGLDVVAVEINPQLAASLRASGLAGAVHCADFLAIDGPAAYVGSAQPGADSAPIGEFDVVLMNPPFANGADIKHIEHAARFLRPGGTLVALCAAGPRQHAQLLPLVRAYGGSWEELPAGSFAESGTDVRVVLLSFTVPMDDTAAA